MISALILTKNEEVDLPGCLNSLLWCEDVHVFDSYSTDLTVPIAIKAGVKVTQRKFDNYAAQRNAALQQLPFKSKWVLILDADERIPEDLVPKLLAHVKEAPDSVNGFRIRRRDYLGNSWLKRAQISPFYIRLVRLGSASYHRDINEVLHVEGTVQMIEGYFDHYPFSKGFTHWLNKHNHYSTMEASRWLEEQNGSIKFSFIKALCSSDFSERRFHQKGIFYKLPGRPLLKWCYMVFGRRAFLDGRAGIIYATLQAIYEYLIVLKTQEMLQANTAKNTSILEVSTSNVSFSPMPVMSISQEGVVGQPTENNQIQEHGIVDELISCQNSANSCSKVDFHVISEKQVVIESDFAQKHSVLLA